MPELVVVSGMSGAGRTEAMHAFEDLGYFCVDNLPSSLIGNLLELAGMPGQPDGKRRLAVVCDARNRDFFPQLASELDALNRRGIDHRVIFLDAADEKLVCALQVQSPAPSALRGRGAPSARASSASASFSRSCARARTTSSTPPTCCRRSCAPPSAT